MLKPLPLPTLQLAPLPLPTLPLAPLLPPAGVLVASRPGHQASTSLPTANPRTTVVGADWVQVAIDRADDAYARVELVNAGVPLAPGSLVPLRGTMHILRTTSEPPAHVYRWRV